MIVATEVNILKALTTQLTVLTSENCFVDPQLRSFLGVKIGDQILIEKSNDVGKWGLLTIYGDYEDGSDNDDMRLRLSARERFQETDTFNAMAYAWQPYSDKTTSWLEANNGLGEFIDESNSCQSDVLILAPHGGMIERGTAEIGTKISAYMNSFGKEYTFWCCRGWQSKLGAYNAWHITSTDLSTNSFPLLKEVSIRSFDRAISIHGFDEDYVSIGGGGSVSFKEGIKQALLSIRDFPYPVIISTTGLYAGIEPQNIVNRFSTNGVQIELPLSARVTWSDAISNNVARYLCGF